MQCQVVRKILTPGLHITIGKRQSPSAPFACRARTWPWDIHIHDIDAASFQMPAHCTELADNITRLGNERKGLVHKDRRVEIRLRQVEIYDISFDCAYVDILCLSSTLGLCKHRRRAINTDHLKSCFRQRDAMRTCATCQLENLAASDIMLWRDASKTTSVRRAK